METTRACEDSARASPSALEASSTVPNASMRGSSFGERPPPSKPVVPSSPVPARSSIGFRRARDLFEDFAEVVQLLRHAPCLFDHVGQGHDLDVAVAPDRYHAALALDDELDGGDAEPRRPESVHRRRRSATLQVTKDRDAGLESGLAFDAAREQVADATLRQPDVTEGILLGLAAQLSLELRDVGALGDDDDAEQLAFAAPAVQVRDDVRDRHLDRKSV